MVISVNHSPISTTITDNMEKDQEKKRDYLASGSVVQDQIEDSIDIKSVILSRRIKTDSEEHEKVRDELERADGTIGYFLNTLKTIGENLIEIDDFALQGSNHDFSEKERADTISSVKNLKNAIQSAIDVTINDRPVPLGPEANKNKLDEINVPLTLNQDDNGISIDVKSLREFFSGISLDKMQIGTAEESKETRNIIKELKDKITNLTDGYAKNQAIIGSQKGFFRNSIKNFTESMNDLHQTTNDAEGNAKVRLDSLDIKQKIYNRTFSLMNSISEDFLKNFGK